MALIRAISAEDASGRFRVELEEQVVGGFTVGWRWRVIDQRHNDWEVAADISHRDADAWCEAWATVALLLSSLDHKLEGAYSVGLTQY